MKKIYSLLLFIGISSSVFANATVSQKEWRWRNDDNNEMNATWKAAQGVAVSQSLCRADENIRLRMSFLVNFDPANPVNTAVFSNDYKISYSTSPGGTYTKITTDGSVNDFELYASSFVSGGAPTSQQLTTTGGTNYVAGSVIDSTTLSNILFTTPASVNSITEYEWVIRPTANVQAQTYYFKLEGLNGTYTTLPSFTFTPVANTISTQTITACDSLVSPSGNYTWTASGIYNDTISNAAGCDSVITTDLTIAHPNTGDTTAIACNSFDWYGATLTTSGTATHTLTNVSGCDSVLTLHLTINMSSTGDTTAVACGSFDWYGTTYSGSGTPTHTLTNMAGCDSVLTLHLTINTVDVGTTTSNVTITADAAGAAYQWIDCGNANQPLAGETNQSFTAVTDGNYAVIVTENGCTDTSACVNIVGTGINQYSDLNPHISVYPNPSNGTFTMKANAEGVYTIQNSLGQSLQIVEVTAGHAVTITGLENGIYFIMNEKGILQQKIVVVK